MFPAVCPPAAEFEDETFYDISTWGLLVEFEGGVENVVQHTPFERHIAFERRETVGRDAERIYRQGVHAVQEAVYILRTGNTFELRPVDLVVVSLHEQRPVEQMPQSYVYGSEMRRGVPQQKQRVKIRRRQKYPATAYLHRLARL